MAAAVAGVLLLEPLRSFAATTADCTPTPTPTVPESPLGPALLIAAGLGALGLVAYRRRRRGPITTIVSTLAVVVLCASLLGTVLASAATSPCPDGGQPSGQNVGGTGSSTPLTGADIPWITGGVLVASGAVFIAISPKRRRSRSG